MATRQQIAKLTLHSLVLAMFIIVLIMISHMSLWYPSTNIRNVIYSESPIHQKTLRGIVAASWSPEVDKTLNRPQPTKTFWRNWNPNSSKEFYDQFRNKFFLMLNNYSTGQSHRTSPEFKFSQFLDKRKDPEIRGTSTHDSTKTSQQSVITTVGKNQLASSSEDSQYKTIGDNTRYSCRRNKDWNIPSCSKLIAGNKREQLYALHFTRACWKEVATNNDFIKATSNCEDYRKAQKYIMNISEEEAKFPLAFSIMMYKDAKQVEDILKAIYRPHNHYCIHVDAKADLKVHLAIQNITRCLKNVNMASRSIPVEWGKFSVLESELICMRDLLHYSDWKYFINLTGQEYPLKTNLQIVKILKLFHGANSVDVDKNRAVWRTRWRKRGRPPHGIKPRKGNIHVVLNRQFVNYTLNNRVSKDFIKWLNYTKVPDETLFASLNHNPQLGIPGSYIGNNSVTNWENKPYIGRFKVWKKAKNPYFDFSCGGKWVRSICIFGYKDLPMLTHRVELFANKFHWHYQSITLDCMQEWYRNLVEMEVDNPNKMWINETYYKNIPYLNDTIRLST